MEKRMNRKTSIFLMVGVACIVLCALYLHFWGGSVGPVTKEMIGASQIYTEEEIQAAMDQVQSYFMRNFKDCTMTELWYDEAVSSQETAGWSAQYQSKEAIVLLSNFEVGASGGDGSLEPNSTYQDWKWVLVRDSKNDNWTLKTWGYA